MTNLLQRIRRGSRSITTVEDYLAAVETMTFNGHSYGLTGVNTSYGAVPHERIREDFVSYAAQCYGNNSVVFALMAVRQLAFSAVRFQWQQMIQGRGDRLFGTDRLRLLEEPWPGGTTQDLLAKMITDADLAGNSYWAISGNELVRLRPDWVDILLEERQVPTFDQGGGSRLGTLGWKKAGYLYWEGGRAGEKDPVILLPGEVAHFAPLQDPLATYRGMSWLTPLIREVNADNMMTNHRRMFFRNAAVPNMIIKHGEGVTPADARLFKQLMEMEYTGAENAYKTMHVGNGADVQVVGTDFKQMDFKSIQGASESRIAAAAGVPPIIPGFSEGLAAATYCLPYSEPVWTPEGFKKIGQVRAGDVVWSYIDGKLAPRQVTWQGKVGEKAVFKIKTKNRVLYATGNHPVLVSDGDEEEWVRIDELDLGEKIVQVVAQHQDLVTNEPMIDGVLSAFEVESIDLYSIEAVYDITVEEGHSFIASGVVVHNSNYGQALRRFAGLTMHPLWQNAAGSLQPILKPPTGVRLWYDTRDVAFLREDSHDLAEIQQTQAATISSYISAGFTPESAAAAVADDDISLLKHTGLISVQLWTPGTGPDEGDTDTGEGNGGGAEPDSTPPQEQGQLGGDEGAE